MYRIIIIFLLIPNLVEAQCNFDSIKFELIKVTINFLSSDTATFPHSKGDNIDCEYQNKPHIGQNYDCLSDYCTNNELIGTIFLVEKSWRKAPVTSSSEINSLYEKIINDITQKPTKAFRINLPSYQIYRQRADALLNAVKRPTLSKSISSKKEITSNLQNDRSLESKISHPESPKNRPIISKPINKFVAIVSAISLIISLLALHYYKKQNQIL